MAYKVKTLPSALHEIDEIISYLNGHGRQATDSFRKTLRSQVGLIESGVVDFGLSHIQELADLGYHTCRVNSYALLYYYEDDAVVIAHIFHQRQDYARLVEPTAGLTLIEGSKDTAE